MATTTLKTWSEGTEDDQNGLEIGGIKVTYAELSEIHDRQSAVDMGVTPDLLDMWENQGGRHHNQLVDWLYQVEEHQREEEDRDDDTPRPRTSATTTLPGPRPTSPTSSAGTSLATTVWTSRPTRRLVS